MGIRTRAALGALLCTLVIAPAGASAATFDVNTTADTTVAGGCTSDPACSLRDAVAAANASTDTENTIRLPAGTYGLTAGQLDVAPATATATVIDGAGARATTVDAGGASRAFALTLGATTISDLTLTGGNGDTGAGPEPGDGGAIVISGSPTTPAPSLTILDSTIRGNSAAFAGGGIAAPSFHTPGGTGTSTVTIERSTIANNELTGGSVPAAAMGAGINTYGNLDITNSTITQNSISSAAVVNMGGGIAAGVDPTATGPSTVEIVNSTISANSAAGAATTMGGGLAIPSASASVGLAITNTIIAGNDVNGTEANCSGLVAPTSANNLTGDASCMFTDTGSVQADPQLGPLADNGGQTDTLLLSENSPAVDAGTDAGCPATDQRGVARPQRARCDIGAVELAPPPPPPPADTTADIAVTAKAKKSTRVRKRVSFKLRVTNAGPDTAMAVTLSGAVSQKAKKVKPKGECKLTAKKRRLECSLGDLASGASRAIKLTVAPKKVRKLKASVGVSSATADPTPENDKAKRKVKVKKPRRK